MTIVTAFPEIREGRNAMIGNCRVGKIAEELLAGLDILDLEADGQSGSFLKEQGG